ncbi:MAG TPA: 4Fe-4S dicluster domain-containing protein, partial [Chthonomonadaceae bacterium]|nr:4Fe-4S dicluster domain-containing protein [Chthonomonadaceae bacterium]
HALAHAMNAALGAVGNTVVYTEPVVGEAVDQMASLKDLVSAMQAGQVRVLLILGSNPVYTCPADLDFAGALAKVPTSVHLGLYEDETAALCQWHIPELHYLETWSDARTYDGTATILQPLIAPLYTDGKSAHELLDALLTPPGRSSHDIVKAYWKGRSPGGDFETFWRKALHDGVVPDTAAPVKTVTLQPLSLPPAPLAPAVGQRQAGTTETSPLPQRGRGAGGEGFSAGGAGLEIVFRPDPTIWDGRYANNGWLQELPKPLSKLTWDNAALVSPRTAEALQLSPRDTNTNLANSVQVVELEYRGRRLRAPVWILPGHPDNAITITLGYGRTRAGNVGTGVGVNAYALRTSDAPWFGAGLQVRNTDDLYRLACTHSHHTMEGRDLIRFTDIEAFRRNPDFAHGKEYPPDKPPMLLPESPRGEYAWAMEIDNNVCIGCNACVVACQAENNIAVVGKAEVLRGREMHWLRIDRYYVGKDLDNPAGAYFMPVPCMQCEKAPCELVCPVDATLHSEDGLNQMVYNRCVGTRYCSNNCPYKVRRFNFLNYEAISPVPYQAPVMNLIRNPEVTWRTTGVMEKCTYCVQRLQNAKITAEIENRRVRDGEVMTACQQACPTNAIIFGDLNDPSSQVSKLKAEPHNYGLLTELNTRPRTTYLARLTNPNPATKQGTE